MPSVVALVLELSCFSSLKQVYNLFSNYFSVDECLVSRASIEKWFLCLLGSVIMQKILTLKLEWLSRKLWISTREYYFLFDCY